MTYCLGIVNRCGIVMASDSRTNARVDYNISTYKKLFEFAAADDRTVLLRTSGNLSITQDVLAKVNDSFPPNRQN
jgi:putative proteasome-type protease